jgi:hypothetical protein
MSRNFRPRVTEPPRGNGYGFAVELEFHEKIKGLNGDTVVIDLQEGATMKQADELVSLLARLGERVRVSNPK